MVNANANRRGQLLRDAGSLRVGKETCPSVAHPSRWRCPSALEVPGSGRKTVRRDRTRENTHLQFIERETTAEASLEVVSLGRRVHDRAKSARDRARERLLGLELARVAARLLAAGCARRKQKKSFSVSLIVSAIATRSRARARGMPLTAARKRPSRDHRRTLVEPGADAALTVDGVALPVLLEVRVWQLVVASHGSCSTRVG